MVTPATAVVCRNDVNVCLSDDPSKCATSGDSSLGASLTAVVVVTVTDDVDLVSSSLTWGGVLPFLSLCFSRSRSFWTATRALLVVSSSCVFRSIACNKRKQQMKAQHIFDSH